MLLYPFEGKIVLLILAAESNREDDNVLQHIEGMDPLYICHVFIMSDVPFFPGHEGI